MESYEIGSGSSITLNFRLRGGAPPQEQQSGDKGKKTASYKKHSSGQQRNMALFRSRQKHTQAIHCRSVRANPSLKLRFFRA